MLDMKKLRNKRSLFILRDSKKHKKKPYRTTF